MKDGKAFDLLALSIPLFVIVITRCRCYYDKQQHQHFKQQQEEQEQEQEQEQEEQEEQVQEWSWAELDRNLLGEIVSRLCATDQARFRAVCTHWLAAAHPIINANATKSSSSLPWHGCKHPPGSTVFHVYDPLSTPNHLASRYDINFSELGILCPRFVYFHNVKHNWLFLCFTKPKLFFWTRRYVVLFSPFTKRIITLPAFDYPNRFKFHATFSTQPDLQDCVFCMLDANQVDKIAVLTYRNGDKQWTARQFNRHPDFQPCFFLPQILHGTLYILSPLGQVASYNILNGQFNFDRLLQDEFLSQNSRSRKIISFVLNGELMIICFNPDVKDDAIPGQQFVTRYDRSLKVWIPVQTLADYAVLIFGTGIANFSLINTKGRTCNGVLPNKVYRFFLGGCLVYSIEDGQLVQFKSINSNLLKDGGDDLPEYKYNYAIPDSCITYWLEAPRVRSSSPPLKQSRYVALETREIKAQYVPLDDESEFPNQILHWDIQVQYLLMDNGLGK